MPTYDGYLIKHDLHGLAVLQYTHLLKNNHLHINVHIIVKQCNPIKYLIETEIMKLLLMWSCVSDWFKFTNQFTNEIFIIIDNHSRHL